MGTSAASPVAGYNFAEFRLDINRGCLTLAGQELRLRHQSFQLLRYFLEHPGVVLSKDELTSVIWNNTSVNDNALAQCIADIRKELNDDSYHPRFIKTVPKLGYRFIASVEEDSDVPHASHLKEVSPTPQLLLSSSQEEAKFELTDLQFPSFDRAITRFRGLWRLFSLVFVTLFVLVLHGDVALDHRMAVAALPSIADPPMLAVFPFSNETGRQDLDWFRAGLSDMILTNLAHTVRWNVLSREQVHTLLDNRVSHGSASLETMLEAARSAHIKDFIVGTVSMNGQQIAIRVETHDGRDGHLIATDSTAFQDDREIVAEADLLSTDISRHLGFSVTDASPSLAKVMTGNVDAYRYYSLGVEKAEQYQNAQAIELFKKAIEYDPQFAMAYARIGYEYAAQELQPQEGRPYLEHALHLSQQLPTLNRLYLEAWSAMARSDTEAAISILRDITIQYPDETEAYSQLTRILRGQGRVEEAANLLRTGIQKNPNAKDLYNQFGLILMLMNRPQDSIAALKQYVALAPQNPNAHDSLGMSYQWAGQYDASEAEYNQALRFDPEFEPSVAHLGDVYYQEGRYRDALIEYRHLIKIAAHSSDAKAIGYGDLSLVYRTMGDLSDAQLAATQEIRNNRNAVWDMLVVALDRNQWERARVLQQILLTNPPNSERNLSINLRMEYFYHGFIELKTGRSQDAISLFKLALQHLPPSSGMDLHEDCLANAFLELGMVPDAIAEYQRILKLNPNYPLVYYHLGLSYQRIHDREHAISAFEHFLQATPSADPDSPPILEAKRFLHGDVL